MNTGIHASHVGYLPSSRKIAVLDPRWPAGSPFVVRMCDRFPKGGTPVALRGVLQAAAGPWGEARIADFSSLQARGFFQVAVGLPEGAAGVLTSHPEVSYPFLIADDVYAKTLKMAFDYFGHQRCGVDVPGYHPLCHTDDAIHRESHEHRDTSGGWHDAGDVRKWLSHLLLYSAAFTDLSRRLRPAWNRSHTPWGDVLDEARWGNGYFLKMLDRDTGQIYHDVAGGVNGDNSDCRWTDNAVGTGDERHLAGLVSPGHFIPWLFVLVQAQMAEAFARLDPAYAATCLEAAKTALKALPDEPPGQNVVPCGFGVLAMLAMARVDPAGGYMDRGHRLAGQIVSSQQSGPSYGQNRIDGYLHCDPQKKAPFQHYAKSGIPLTAIASIHLADPRPQYKAFVERYVHGYAAAMAAMSPFGLLPFSLYVGQPGVGGKAWPLAGELSYRFFCWDLLGGHTGATPHRFEHGQQSHVLSHATAFLLADRVLGDGVARALALRHLEWTFGANPASACLMTGAGANTPYPFSPFVGVIPGGMLNGFNGGEQDLPNLHLGNTLHWETTEYCGIHNAHYLWAIGLLYEGLSVAV